MIITYELFLISEYTIALIIITRRLFQSLLNRKNIFSVAIVKKRILSQFLYCSLTMNSTDSCRSSIRCSHTRLFNEIRFSQIEWEHIKELTLIEPSLYMEVFSSGKDVGVKETGRRCTVRQLPSSRIFQIYVDNTLVTCIALLYCR